MKSAYFFWLSAVAAFGQAVERESEIRPRPNTPEEVVQNKKEHDALMGTIPFEQRPSVYIETAPDELVPAIIDEKAGIEYRWRDVTLHSRQIPRLGTSGSLVPFAVPATGYPVRYIDPPLRYQALGEQRYAIGYYDRTYGNFYQLRGRTIAESQLPLNASADSLIVPAGVRASVIDLPLTAERALSVQSASLPATSTRNTTQNFPQVATRSAPAKLRQKLPSSAAADASPWTEQAAASGVGGSDIGLLCLGIGTLVAAIFVIAFGLSRRDRKRKTA
jgi:hypothetical protein